VKGSHHVADHYFQKHLMTGATVRAGGLFFVSNVIFLFSALLQVVITIAYLLDTKSWEDDGDAFFDFTVAVGYTFCALIGILAGLCRRDSLRCGSAITYNIAGFFAFLLGAVGSIVHVHFSFEEEGSNATSNSMFGLALGVGILYLISSLLFLRSGLLVAADKQAAGDGQHWTLIGDWFYFTGSCIEIVYVLAEELEGDRSGFHYLSLRWPSSGFLMAYCTSYQIF